MRTQNPNSLEAYKNMQPKIPTDHDKILSVMKKDKAMTYNEIAKEIRLKAYEKKQTKVALSWVNPNKVSRRIPELIRLKRIKIKGDKICSIAKSKCRMYVLI